MGGAKEIRIVVVIVKRPNFIFDHQYKKEKIFILADHDFVVILYFCKGC